MTPKPLLPQFTIHSVNAYSHVMLEVMSADFKISPTEIQNFVQGMHKQVVKKLAAEGVNYGDLRWALQPRSSRSEIAFLFDSESFGNSWYGLEAAKAWVPALRDHGPKRTAVSEGDVMDVPIDLLWSVLDENLIRTQDFPRLHPSGYFVVYFTNMNVPQLTNMDAAVRRATSAYLGYIDCSTWNPLKWGLQLPQRGLRCDDVWITTADEDGEPYDIGYPYKEVGLRIVGMEDSLYGVLLEHKIDNGIPQWANTDSAITLSVLGGANKAVNSIDLVINQSRIQYLEKNHGASLGYAGLDGLDPGDFAEAIKAKIGAGLIFNLRSIEGTRNGARAPENDATVFTVQVEFLDANDKARRYQVGIKYSPAKHSGEVTTFF